MDASSYKYRGFISYSHQDRRWGEWLHRRLEAYRVPARLAGSEGRHGPIPKRLYPMFRDRDELPTAGALSEALAQALAASHSFVLVCSPAAARSRWVNEEILQFKRLGGEGRILCLIVDGEPHATTAGHPERECFPPALRFKLGTDGELSNEPAEPLAADARPGGDGRDHARLKIIAGLLGVTFGELRQRDLQARNRRLAVLAGIAIGVATLTIALAIQAMFARRAAEKSRQQGENLIGFMLGDLRAKLEPLGKLDILDAVGDKAMGYFDQLDSRNLSEAALTARAKALRQIGDVRMNQGRAAEAVEAFDAALALNRKLAQRHAADADLQFELGQSEFWVGYAAFRAHQLDRAETHFFAYQTISQHLVDGDPANPKWTLELAYASNNLGSLASERNDNEAAIAHFRHAAEAAGVISPQTAETQYVIANSLSWQGTALQYLGRLPEAIAALEQQSVAYRGLSAQQPEDMPRRFSLTRSLSALGFALIASGEATRALAVSEEGEKIANALVANDAANQNYLNSLAAHAYICAAALTLQHRWIEARASNDKVDALLRRLRGRYPNAFDYRQLQVRSRELEFNLALAQGQREAAQEAVTSALAAAPCSDSKEDQLEAARMECARAHLLAFEFLPDDPAAAEHRRFIEHALDRTSIPVGDTASFDTLLARQQLLLGQSDGALPIVTALQREHYGPPDWIFYLQRHCDPVLRSLLGPSCIIKTR